MVKVVCATRDLKKNEKRGSMEECAKKKQIRYWGIKKADPLIIKIASDKNKKIDTTEYTYETILGAIGGLKSKMQRLLKNIESAKKADKKDKLKDLQEELAAEKRRFAMFVPIYKKLAEEKEKEEKQAKKKKK